MSFGQGLSGLKGAAQKLDVIGNNIANSGTVGFKSSSVSFADVYASSRVGLGTQISAVNQDFSVGNLSVTGGQFDLAIDGGVGMFRVEDASGSVYFTRNGQFSPDKNGYLENAQGQYLTGYLLNQATGTYGLNPEPIRIPTGNIAPRATGTSEVEAEKGITVRRMNLDADAVPPAAWDATSGVADPDGYNMSVPMTVYDSLGKEHQLTQYFRKLPATAGDTDTYNKWEVYYQLDNVFLDDPVPIQFGDNGLILDAFSKGELEFEVEPAAKLVIPVNYAGATQFGGPFNYEFRQDGYATGEYASMSVSPDGTIVANYTNGELLEVGYVVLADFPNMQGLKPAGGNAWLQTAEAGALRLGRPGENGLSQLMSQAVEESNVGISTELVNMIITQRTYQANAQSISTQSEMMQALMNIR